MTRSGEIWVSSKIAELASRCGISPTIADFSLTLFSPEDSCDYHYVLAANDGVAEALEDQEKVQKVWSLLGMEDSGHRRFDTLREVEEAVDHALSLAPRARAR
ncbi:hypothetical protein P1X14_12300 [Sphingomonas sp. AOB5]|uniref:hypothetical protein n=1 Tax=Sphingomonas sp. AOB5 TaxID=3034017 RepID=UPI0023F94173|nr:hypothetical protein [Sphingomonas sp. AOB5]MDF7776031.1 hypothetical protein [Sphingomonas sp. AOB5]